MNTPPPPCTLHKVSPHVYWFTPESHTDRPSLGAVVGEQHTLLLDIGASPAHTRDFLAALAAEGVPAPSYAVLTHAHWDHFFGSSALNIPIIAHRLTAEQLATRTQYDYSDSGLQTLIANGQEVEFCAEHMRVELTDAARAALTFRSPQIVFDGQLTLALGGVSAQVVHVGGDHAADSTVIYIPEDKLLFLGDCFYFTVYELPRHYTRDKVLPLIARLESFGATQFIEGHSDTPIDRVMMQTYFEAVREIYTQLTQGGTQDLDALKASSSADAQDFFDYIVNGLNRTP